MALSQRNHLDPFSMPQVSTIFTFFEGTKAVLCPVALLEKFCYTCVAPRTFTRRAPHIEL